MSENSTSSNKIRDQMRKESVKERLLHRQQRRDLTRKNLEEVEEELEVLKLTTREEFLDVVAKVKQGKHTSHMDLRSLKQGLQDHENSVSFLRITGALAAVVGHLTGRRALHQLEAAYICCNLATGGEYQCVSVANAAGPYLIGFLDSQNTTLQVAALWTLGNLAGGSPKSRRILQSQGFIDCLIHCLKCPRTEVVEATLYALILIVKATASENQSERLSPEIHQQIASAALQLSCCREDVDWLIFLLSCTSDCDNILLEHDVTSIYIDSLADLSRGSPLQVNELSVLRSITAMIRTLANLSSGENGIAAWKTLSHSSFLLVMNDLLHASHSHVRIESEWLVQNLLSHSSDVNFKQCHLADLCKVFNARGHDYKSVQLILSDMC